MKIELDALMSAADLDAVLIQGAGQHNPAMVYLTGGAHLTGAYLVKKRGEPGFLYCSAMERDEAALSGLEVRLMDQVPFSELMAKVDGDLLEAMVLRLEMILEDAGVTSGRMAIYGQADLGSGYAILSRLQARLSGLTLVGELGHSVLSQARTTKDEEEVARIRQMGTITVGVVGQVADFLSGQRVQDEVLVDEAGDPVTIGAVKRHLNLWLAARGVENPKGTIFAQGRDAGIPHSTGNPTHPLRLGQTIVFDIFPSEAGGGYFYDFTRTWCLGYAPDEALALYEDVLAVYQQIMGELRLGTLCRDYQKRTCELFAAQGHPTICDTPQTQDGYVHSLGHGLGLNVHERPLFGVGATETDRLDPGVVVTIEPGLYYPDRGMGVRLEDSVYARPDGVFEVLADYPLDLVLPVGS
jgi:Xaa-Pro aminopeptidase